MIIFILASIKLHFLKVNRALLINSKFCCLFKVMIQYFHSNNTASRNSSACFSVEYVSYSLKKGKTYNIRLFIFLISPIAPGFNQRPESSNFLSNLLNYSFVHTISVLLS